MPIYTSLRSSRPSSVVCLRRLQLLIVTVHAPFYAEAVLHSFLCPLCPDLTWMSKDALDIVKVRMELLEGAWNWGDIG